MDKKKGLKIAKNIAKIVVTVGALYWVFSKVSLKDLKEAVINSNPLYLFFALVAYSISIFISSSRLLTFLKAIGLDVTEKYNLKLYQLGLFYNLILPGGVGGDGYKIFFLRKRFNIKGRKLFTALFLDRLSGLWALCLIIAALVTYMPQLGIPNYLTIILFIIGSILYYFIVIKFFKEYKATFLKAHLKAIGVQSMQVTAAILILYALGFSGKFSPYLFLFLASSLVSIIPFSVGGLGMRELVIMWGAGIFQVDSHNAVLITLLFYIISALVALSGIYFIFHPQAIGEDKLPSAEEVEQSQKLEE